MKNIFLLYLGVMFASLSYGYSVYCACKLGDLSFINPLKHHLPDGSLLFVGAPVTWILGGMGFVSAIVYTILEGGYLFLV